MNTLSNQDYMRLFAPLSRAALATSGDIDLKNYANNRQLKVITDTSVTTAGTLDFKIQHGDATDAYTDLDTTSFTQITDSTSAGVQEFHIKTNKRYVRALVTPAGSGTYVFSAGIVAPLRSV